MLRNGQYRLRELLPPGGPVNPVNMDAVLATFTVKDGGITDTGGIIAAVIAAIAAIIAGLLAARAKRRTGGYTDENEEDDD